MDGIQHCCSVHFDICFIYFYLISYLGCPTFVCHSLLNICISLCAVFSSTWSNTRRATPLTTRLSQRSASGPSTPTALPLGAPSTEFPSPSQKTWGTCECHVYEDVNIWINVSVAKSSIAGFTLLRLFSYPQLSKRQHSQRVPESNRSQLHLLQYPNTWTHCAGE